MARIRPRQWSSEEKTALVLTFLRGEATAAELCRRHGMSENSLYAWRERFLVAGQGALTNGKAKRGIASKVEEGNRALKEVLAEAVLRNELLKKTRLG